MGKKSRAGSQALSWSQMKSMEVGCRARMNSSTVFGSQSGALAGMRIRLGTAQSPRDMILGHWKCDYAYINDVVFSISISISLLFFIIPYFHCYLLFVLLRNVSKQLLLLLLLLLLILVY